MTPEQQQHIDKRFDDLKSEVTALTLSVEHRVTKVEERVGLIGLVTGLVGGLVASLRGH